MQFYRRLYISPEIEHPWRARQALKGGKGSLSLYVVTLCEESLTGEDSHGVSDVRSVPDNRQYSDQLQFFCSIFLRNRQNLAHCPMVIGMAKDRRGAMEIVRQIAEDCHRETGDYDLVHFLAKHDDRIRPGTPLNADRKDDAFAGSRL